MEPRNDELEQEIVRLYDSYSAGLNRYASTLTTDPGVAQDAVQEVFLRFALMLKAGRPVDSPKAWLFRVLRNYLLDLSKAYRARNEVGLEDVPDPTDRSGDPEQQYATQELSERISQSLTPREMECLRLRGEGLRYHEIAEVLSVHPGTVATLLSRSISRIRKLRGGEGPAQPGSLAAEDPHAS